VGRPRLGENAALRRCDLDLAAGTVRIKRQVQELKNGQRVEGPPKSEAGRRIVSRRATQTWERMSLLLRWTFLLPRSLMRPLERA
jgi:hypothetical protein